MSTGTSTGMSTGMSSGAGTLLRSYLRRDRWLLGWWILGNVALYYSQGASVRGLYPTQADFDQAAAAMSSNAAFVAMAGPARALDTVGGQVAWQASAFGAIVAGLMSMFLVGRHTRGEEDTGRDELLRAGAVGRYGTVTAVLLELLLANGLLAVLVGVALVPLPLAFADSMALGVGVGLCGLVFGAAALLAAQLAAGVRAAYALTGVVIGASYGVRAIGDVTADDLPWLSWVSPIGWYQGMHAFSGLRWWPALLLVGAATVLTGTAVRIFDRRDYGAGAVPDRPGPALAGPRWPGPGALGLAWRLQRGAVLGWSAGVFLFGLAYGSIGDQVGDLVGGSGTTRELVAGTGDDLVRGFYATALGMLALLVAGSAIASSLRPHGEETQGRVEALLATGLSRTSWLGAHVGLTVAGAAAATVLGGLGLGVGYALATGDADAIGRYAAASAAYLPGVLVLAGLALLIAGALPHRTVVAWAALAVCVVVLFFGPLLGLPGWLQGLSPFDHLARVPAEGFRAAPYALEALLAVALFAAGLAAYRRRDLTG